ncbi:hypothetical protein HWV00_05615 [Moritella sp. 24]|uniref:hypothetical protein n=1 Tax=Moritella sp. 24 TaxID=2746230 RepID=UPI001BAD2CD9|nr:hypothetical protein [Moritella sp. 24]QUM75749.1 hypothetical protein HWV00_05615 [Moritella sp. 24]
MLEHKLVNGRAAVIALVGPEATGKSTIALELENWLALMYKVRVVHAGKPPTTWLTRPVHILLPLIKAVFPKIRTSRLKGHVVTQSASGTSNSDQCDKSRRSIRLSLLVNAFWAVCVAWERRQLLVWSQKAANNQIFIVCDRYPSYRVGAVDSTRLTIKREQKGIISALYNQLARMESRIYQQIPAPDIVLQLNVSLETAKQRNRDRVKVDKEGDGYIESRRRQIQDWHCMGSEVIHYIDTEQPFVDTVKHAIEAIESTLYGG